MDGFYDGLELSNLFVSRVHVADRLHGGGATCGHCGEKVGGRGGMVVRELSEGNFPWKGRDTDHESRNEQRNARSTYSIRTARNLQRGEWIVRAPPD